MEIIVSIGVSPGSRTGEDIVHLPVLKEKLAKFANTENIAVIAIGSAMLSEICMGLYNQFSGKDELVEQLSTDKTSSQEDVFNTMHLKLAIQKAYIEGAKTIFVVSNLDHVSPAPEIRWAEYLGIYRPIGFHPLYLYC